MPDQIEMTAPPLPDKISTFTLDGPIEPDRVPEGFTLEHAADAGLLDGVLEEASAFMRDALDAADEAVLAPDAELAHLRGSVRPALLPLMQQWEEKDRARLADPGRRWLTREGQAEADAQFTRDRDTAFGRLEAPLAAELGRIEARAAEALAAARAPMARPAHHDQALRLAASLSHMTPAHGLPVLAEFLKDGLEDPALLFAALPFLRSMYDREGSQWTRHVGLLRAATTCQKVVEAFAARRARPAEARLERVSRTRWELGQAMAAASNPDPKLRAGAFAAVDQEDRPVLFPDAPVPKPTLRTSAPTTLREFRRLSVPRERRAADQRRRRATGEE